MQAVLLGVVAGGTFPGEGTPESICSLAISILRAQSPAQSADGDLLDVHSMLTVCHGSYLSESSQQPCEVRFLSPVFADEKTEAQVKSLT